LEHLRNPHEIRAPPTAFQGTSTGASALLAAQRSEKIKAERREEKKRLEYDWPKEEEKKRNRERRKETASEGTSLERKQDKAATGGHINFWEGLEKVSIRSACLCPRLQPLTFSS
jgi:hypothetical protein